MENCTSGLYAWGGPGTIRLLSTKYHSPTIDDDSFLTLYDTDRLRQAIDVFGCRDIWVSYSWGFSDETEREDRAFIRARLQALHSLGLRVHLYVQGLNVVSQEFIGRDLACTDPAGRVLPYSKGRQLICPNNPDVIALLTERVRVAAAEEADGVYVDNILFGFPPAFIRSDFAPFFGCACTHCQCAFRERFSRELSFPLQGSSQLRDYLTFREETTSALISTLGTIVRSKGKYFGINLYDPVQMNAAIYFGYDLKRIESALDYFLIENHSHPSTGRSNEHLASLIHGTAKPVFVLSYDQGIGFEPAYSQTMYESIAGEADRLHYHPCYKVSEFTTDSIWHTLDFAQLHSLQPMANHSRADSNPPLQLLSARWTDRVLAWIISVVGIPLVMAYFESPLLNTVGGLLYRRSIHAWKNYEE